MTNAEEQFRDVLALHDWHYMRSDDHSVFSAGKLSHGLVMSAAIKVPCEAARRIWEENAPEDFPFPASAHATTKAPSDAFETHTQVAMLRARRIVELLQQEVNAGKLQSKVGMIQWGDAHAMNRIAGSLGEVIRCLGENPKA